MNRKTCNAGSPCAYRFTNSGTKRMSFQPSQSRNSHQNKGGEGVKDKIKCDLRKQNEGCFSCADNTCPLNYYYEQLKYKHRKTVKNFRD